MARRLVGLRCITAVSYGYPRRPGVAVKMIGCLVCTSVFKCVLLTCAGRVSAQQAAMAYDFNNLIFTAARVPQIIKNFQVRTHHTGRGLREGMYLPLVNPHEHPLNDTESQKSQVCNEYDWECLSPRCLQLLRGGNVLRCAGQEHRPAQRRDLRLQRCGLPGTHVHLPRRGRRLCHDQRLCTRCVRKTCTADSSALLQIFETPSGEGTPSQPVIPSPYRMLRVQSLLKCTARDPVNYKKHQ